MGKMGISGIREMELLEKIGFTRTAGTPEEEKAANILADEIRAIGCEPVIDPFEIEDANIITASLEILEPYQKTYEVTGYKCAKSTPVEGIVADFVYVENMIDVNLKNVKDKIVLVNGRVGMDAYKKLIKAEVAGFVSMNGTLIDRVEETDLDIRKIRKTLEMHGLTTAVNVRIADAFEMIQKKASKAKVVLDNQNVTLTSHNVYTEVKGTEYPDEVIMMGAHYDSVPFSQGVYDNGAGSVTIMEALRYFKANPPKRTVKFAWFGSEEIGLEGSKHYVKAYKEEAEKYVLMVNVDVGGIVLGSDCGIVTGPECLTHFVDYFMKTEGYPVRIEQDNYSSDCVPFADAGVPAISFCRFAAPGAEFMHTRHDCLKFLSGDVLEQTATHVTAFTDKMANAVAFPVPHKIPEKIVEKIDNYLFKKEIEEVEKKKKKEENKDEKKEEK